MPDLLNRQNSCLLIVDPQTSFIQSSKASKDALFFIEALIDLAKSNHLPLMVTVEEPVDQKGSLPDSLEKALRQTAYRYTKKTFDCTSEPPFKKHIDGLKKPQVIVCGGDDRWGGRSRASPRSHSPGSVL